MEPVVSAGGRTWAEVPMSELQDVTEAEVFENTSASAATVTGVTGVSNFEELLLSINNTTAGAFRGWKRDFTEDPAFTPFDTERNITRSLVFEKIRDRFKEPLIGKLTLQLSLHLKKASRLNF